MCTSISLYFMEQLSHAGSLQFFNTIQGKPWQIKPKLQHHSLEHRSLGALCWSHPLEHSYTDSPLVYHRQQLVWLAISWTSRGDVERMAQIPSYELLPAFGTTSALASPSSSLPSSLSLFPPPAPEGTACTPEWVRISLAGPHMHQQQKISWRDKTAPC